VFYSILTLLMHLYEPLSVSAGWDSLEKQQIGPVNWLQKRAYSSWVPSWAAYTSSIAIAQPLGSRIDQGIQKVLDVRFHPGGAPQLVVSCNEVGLLALYDPIIPLPQYRLLNCDSQWGWICNQIFLTLHS
jgi:hypothetical protein